MGIIFPNSYCSANTAHYWSETEKIYGGVLFRCIYCHKHLWLPASAANAEQLGILMIRLGSTEGYCKFLNHASRRAAKVLIAKLQELERISANITDANEMAKIAVKILDQKEYDKKEVN